MLNSTQLSRSITMSSLIPRGGSLLDEFFKDVAPGFYVRPLHGDGLPSPAQIKVDVKESDGGHGGGAAPGVVAQVLPREGAKQCEHGGIVQAGLRGAVAGAF